MTAQLTVQPGDDLIRLAQQGDGGAFDRLLELYTPKVYAIAYRISANAEDAHDITQEAFIRVFQALPQFKWDASFSTWIYRIATNACLDTLKRRRRNPATFTELQGDSDSPFEPSPWLADNDNAEDALLRGERQTEIQRAIVAIPEKYRLILVLYDLQGLSYQEIAEVTRQQIGTVKSRLNRARNILREKLSANWEQNRHLESQRR